MKLFIPELAYIDPKAQKYSNIGAIREILKELNIPIIETGKASIEPGSPISEYVRAKRVILYTTNNQRKLESCKPSADYQFSLSSSCPALCEYCYLQTTQGAKPFIKLFVNIEDIFEVITQHIDLKKPNITGFECSSITDPVGLDHLCGTLKQCIEFFAKSEYGRLRLVTKFSNVDPYLSIKHNGNTTFRFSINSKYVISQFEHNTSSYEERIEAVSKIAKAGYPIGFIIAPIIRYENWKDEYLDLLTRLSEHIKDYTGQVAFELIQHRFTKTAKELILKRFPSTKLDMEEENRQLKWGPYGKFKYVYKKEHSNEIKEFFEKNIATLFPNGVIEYFT